MKHITLVCQEGWTYCSWQKVMAVIDGVNVSTSVANIVNAANQEEGISRLLTTGNHFMVLSGESFGFEDFAECISDLFKLPVILVDGVPDENSPDQEAVSNGTSLTVDQGQRTSTVG